MSTSPLSRNRFKQHAWQALPIRRCLLCVCVHKQQHTLEQSVILHVQKQLVKVVAPAQP